MMDLRASSFGSCIRALVAEQLGFVPREHDEKTEALFESGRVHEEECIAAMRAEGWTVAQEQEEVEFLGITGHLDGKTFFDYGNPTRVLEVKSPTSWAKFEQAYKRRDWSDALMMRYSYQIAVYQLATGLECVVACLDGERIKTFVIEEPIWPAHLVKARIDSIEHWVRRGESALVEMKCSAYANPWFCSFSGVTGCRDKARLPVDDPNGVIGKRLEQFCTLTAAVQQGDEAKRERDKIKAELDELLPVGNLTVGSYSVTTWDHPNNPSFDTDAMKADGVYDKYLKPKTTHRRMNVE